MCLHSETLYRQRSLEEGANITPFLLISELTTLECGFTHHALWYFETERAIPFPGIKNLPVQPCWEALIFSINGLPLSRKQRRLGCKDPLVSLISFLLRNCRYNQRGLDGERNRAQRSLYKKIKRTNQHYLPSVPDRADVK